MNEKAKITDLKILGHQIEVFDIKNLIRDFECYGNWIYADLAINLDTDCQPGVKQATLCHEIIEAWDTLAELNLPHSKIQILGNCLFQLTMDNQIYLFAGPKTSFPPVNQLKPRK